MPLDLAGLFDIVIFDEAHILRNATSGQSVTCSWLKAKFNLLLTATPFFNDLHDFMGYYKLLLAPNPKAAKKFSDKRVAQILEAAPGSADEALLCSQEFVSAHIFAKNIDPQTASVRMRQVLKCFMIRRIQASSIPIGTDRRIGADIPPMVKRIEEPEFEKEEAEAYRAHEAIHRRHLFIKDQEHPERIRWNMSKFRQLILGSSWLGFINIERTLVASKILQAIGAVKRRAWIPLVSRILREKKVIEDETEVKAFYRRRMDDLDKDAATDATVMKTGGLEFLLRGSQNCG